MARLVVVYPTNKQRRFELGKRTELILGRSPSCDVWLDHQLVSRRHARLTRLDDGWFLADLSSENGTYLNDLVIDEKIVRHGDRLRLANVELRFELFDYEDN